jgi:hypothetical protein
VLKIRFLHAKSLSPEGTLYFTDPESLDTNDHYLVTWSSSDSAPVATEARAGILRLDVTGSRMALPAGRTLDTVFPGNTFSIFLNLDNSRPLPPDPDGYVGSAAVRADFWAGSEHTDHKQSRRSAARARVSTDVAPHRPHADC